MRYVINPENLLKYYPIYLDNRFYVFVLDSYTEVDTRSINYFNNGVMSFYSSDDEEMENGFSKKTVADYKLDSDGKSKYCGFIPNPVSSNCIASDCYSFRELLAAVAQENEQLCGSDPVIQKEVDVLAYKVNPTNRGWSEQEKEKINVMVKELSANTLWMDRKNLKTTSGDEIMLITDSYGIFFTPYAIEYFRTVVHMHRQTSAPDEILNILKEEKPDLVLFINVERSVKD